MTRYSDTSYIGLSGGRRFYFGPQVDPAQIDAQDIAQGLSRINRFNGHLDFRWSVLEHSLLVAVIVEQIDPKLRKAALLHDAAEAYCGDLVQPVKALVPEFKDRIEAPIARAIEQRFGVSLCNPLIKQVDLCCCWHEARAGGLKPESWGWNLFPDELSKRTADALSERLDDKTPVDVLAWWFTCWLDGPQKEVEAQ
jgi:hypothetical protein